MAEDPKRDPQRPDAPAQSERPERPVAEREPLTVTVIEPEAAQDVAASPAPPVIIAPEAPIRRIPVPRWYWVLFVLAGTLVYMNYHYFWAARIQKFLEHRVLPPEVVRVENSVWRHTFGGPKHPEGPHSGISRPTPDRVAAASSTHRLRS